MKFFSSIGGDKHEFCLVVVKSLSFELPVSRNSAGTLLGY